MNISISDFNQFLRCRRAWDLQSPNRQALMKIGFTSPSLHVGSAVHVALAAQADGHDPMDALTNWLNREYFAWIDAYVHRVGAAPSAEEEQPFHDAGAVAGALVRRYFDHYGWDTPLGGTHLTYKVVEQSFAVPIPGTDGTLVGTLDGLLHDANTGEDWIIEHKTYSVKPELDRLSLSPQFTAYVWAAEQLLGRPVAGVLYDGIARKVPKPPALLKNGTLSLAFNETVDRITYREAIRRYDLIECDYEDFLAKLDERDMGPNNPYWTRWAIRLTPGQIATFAGDLPRVYDAMRNDPVIYPTFAMAGCWDCRVRDLCSAIQHQEDTQFLIAQNYTTNEGNQSFRLVGAPEVELGGGW